MPQSRSKSPADSGDAPAEPVVITWTGEERILFLADTELVLAAGDTALVPAHVAESLIAQGYAVAGEPSTTVTPQEG